MSGQPIKPFRRGSQRHRLLTVFYSGERLTRFQAETLGCHTLPTLISDLESLGLSFDRRTVSVPTRWGEDAHPMQYWLNAHSYALAAHLLGRQNATAEALDEAVRAYRRASGGLKYGEKRKSP